MTSRLACVLLVAGACAPVVDQPVDDEPLGVAGAPAPLLVAPVDDDVIVVDRPVIDSGVQDEVDELASMTPEELNDLWFNDSGWDCCWSSDCDVIRIYICDDDEVPATDGLHTCCVPDIGQCPAGVE